MASCVAVLSSSNSPLLIRSCSQSRLLSDHYSIHTSIDVIEERTGLATTRSSSSSSSSSSAPSTFRDAYLGQLYATESHRVYGYVSNTQTKFVLIVDTNSDTKSMSKTSSMVLRDNDIRHMFRKLHTAYTQLLFDPFYVPGNPIVSKRFNEVVDNLIHFENK